MLSFSSIGQRLVKSSFIGKFFKPKKVMVYFSDQLIKNQKALNALRETEGMHFDVHYIVTEMSITSDLVAQDLRIGKSKKVSCDIDMNTYKKTENDFIQLQTKVLYSMLKQMAPFNNPLLENVNAEDYNLDKIVICRTSNNEIMNPENEYTGEDIVLLEAGLIQLKENLLSSNSSPVVIRTFFNQSLFD